MHAFCDCVECAGVCEIKVRVEEDRGHGVESGDELGDGGSVGLGGLEEAVPVWRDCAEVGIKVLASHAGEVGGGYGGEEGVCFWGRVTLVGAVEHIGDGWEV